MRIGLVIYGSLETVSGGYLYDRRLAAHLRSAGDEVVLISLPRHDYDRCLLHNARPSLWQALRHNQFDVLIEDELCHPSLFLLNRRLRRRCTLPVISVVHHLRSSERHPPRHQARHRIIERAYLQSVDGFIYNSATTREATEALSQRSRPYVIAYPAADHVTMGLDAGQVAARARRNGPLNLLFVGNVIRRKGLHTLTAALTRLPPGSWHLSIVGDLRVSPDYAWRVREQVKRAGNAGHVTWHGSVEDAGLYRMMAGSDLLIVPASYEGFGIVYLEGMAFGLPAIGTTAGGAKEIITDGENGFLIVPGNVDELARRLWKLDQDRRLLGQMSEAALARFRTAPTWAESMSRMRYFLHEQVRKKG